jgi:iron-sulfur cluster assembly accessory protein
MVKDKLADETTTEKEVEGGGPAELREEASEGETKGGPDACGKSTTGGVLSGGEEGVITLSPLAESKVLEILDAEGFAPDALLRVGVIGGGCAGLSYDMNVEEGEKKSSDKVIKSGKVNLIIDEMSLMYLAGTEIEYVSSLQGTGFKFNNPNAKTTCRCSQSFS